jgi:TMAO reductase system sensor TorS
VRAFARFTLSFEWCGVYYAWMHTYHPLLAKELERSPGVDRDESVRELLVRVDALVRELDAAAPEQKLDEELLRTSISVSQFSANLREIHRLHTTAYDTPVALVQDFVATGCRIFDLETGIISRITGDRYVIEAVESPIAALAAGSELCTADTFCAEVVRSAASVAWHDIGADPQFASHPLVVANGFRTYIGTPITVDGALFGTLSFASTTARAEPFLLSTLEILELLAESIGRALERRERDVQRERTQQALIEARDAAEQAARAKSEFLATMSHEIRTPMNAVIGMTELLIASPLSDEQRDFAETIHRSGIDLLAILNDILDFSKIESGRLEIEHHPFDLHACVRDTVDLLSYEARARGIDVALAIADAVPVRVSGDITRLRQVLVNLLSNAIKFTEKGRVDLAVDLERRDGDRHTLRFTVRDTGIGIPADKLPRLFRSFTQVDSSTTRRYGGTGLGLAIAARLVAMMDGEISVTSRVNEGSTFTFTIRVGCDAGTNAAEVVRDAAPVHESVDALRVLVVEDNPINLKVTLGMLRKIGQEADVAHNGAEALAAVERAAYDLVLMDVQMPVMDGLEATEKIRTLDAQMRQPRIVAMTANALLGDRERCLEAGMDDYLSKPLRQDDITRILHEAHAAATRVVGRATTTTAASAVEAATSSVPPSPAASTSAVPPPLPELPPRSAEARPAEALLDEPRIRELIAMDAGSPTPMYAELLDIFAEQTIEILVDLDAAWSEGDATRCERAAHKLKGSAANLGMIALAARCSAMQRNCAASTRNIRREDLDEVRMLCRSSLAAARTLLA